MVAFADFLARSLELLAREAPRSYEDVYARLGGRRVGIEVDGEAVSISPRWGKLVPGALVGDFSARASASRAVLGRLLAGERDLTQAILDDDVVLIGALEDLTAFYDALIAYFGGAVRCRTFPDLLEEFLADARAARAVP
jgi:hypothetical protein